MQPARPFTHLSKPHPEWIKVAESHRAVEEKMTKLYSLPIEEFRKVSYRPAPLSANAPRPGHDLVITEREIEVRDGTKIGIRIYKPIQHSQGHPLYFNIHGGGWTVGSPETEEGLNRMITVKNNAVVVSVDYRKAPEFPFPYPLNDSLDAFRWMLQNTKSLGVDPNKLIIGGGSAGANMATVITQILQDEGTMCIKGQILNIPVTCHPDHHPLKGEDHSFQQNSHAPIVNAERMRWFWDNYLSSDKADDPRASPLLSKSLRGLPQTFIQIAGMDPLRDEGIEYAEALQKNGVDVTLKVYPGMPHGFYIYPDLGPSHDYVESTVDWIKKLVGDKE